MPPKALLCAIAARIVDPFFFRTENRVQIVDGVIQRCQLCEQFSELVLVDEPIVVQVGILLESQVSISN